MVEFLSVSAPRGSSWERCTPRPTFKLQLPCSVIKYSELKKQKEILSKFEGLNKVHVFSKWSHCVDFLKPADTFGFFD